MPIFDAYIVVDWSARNKRVANGQNCIWIAHGSLGDDKPHTESPRSRTEAIDRIIELTCEFLDNNQHGRILACFDFAFAFPRGVAEHLSDQSANVQRWEIVWDYLSDAVKDDCDTEPGHVPSNHSNRFDVGNQLNQLIGGEKNLGPFWCAAPNWRQRIKAAGKKVWIPQNQPKNFTSNRGVQIPRFRITDQQARSDSPFRLFGNGSVGSQVLTGIPRLQQLRQSPQIGERGRCCVWPFETGWAVDNASWPGDNVRMVIAEIYPSVREPLDDIILDRGQVRAMWHWARDMDKEDQLIEQFQRPDGLEDSEEKVVCCEEGWILR